MGQLTEPTVNEVLADRQTTHLQMRYATWSMSQNCAFCAGVHGSSGGIAGRAESAFRSRAVSIADGRRSLVVLAAEVSSWPVWITEPVS
jgi:hypothetical protein